MSKVKAIICTALLYIVIFTLLIVAICVDGAYGINLFHFIMFLVAGMYIGDRCFEFYEWLRKDA